MQLLAKLGAASIFAATLVTGAHAQEFHPYLPNTGTKEIDFSATINFDPVDSYSVFGRVGYFFNRNFQLGLDASYTKVDNGESAKFYDLGVFANLHFPTSTPWLPYVGLFGGVADGSGMSSSGSWGAQGGAKYFFNPNVAGFAELRWRDLESSDEQLGIFFGLSVFFR